MSGSPSNVEPGLWLSIMQYLLVFSSPMNRTSDMKGWYCFKDMEAAFLVGVR
jgi:hypothetical protein